MLFNQVNFRKFSLNVEEIIDTLPAYRPIYWPEDWEIVCVPHGNEYLILEWGKERLAGQMNLVGCHNGDVLVAFSDPTDAILFKISYQNGVTEICL